MLEFFEIIYRMKARQKRNIQNLHIIKEQMFFIPSLLSRYLPGEDHPVWKFWHLYKCRYTLFGALMNVIGNHTCRMEHVRHFRWNFYPAGFFPRLLLRLVHLRVKPLKSWLDAAVVVGHRDECAFMRISKNEELSVNPFFMEVFYK